MIHIQHIIPDCIISTTVVRDTFFGFYLESHQKSPNHIWMCSNQIGHWAMPIWRPQAMSGQVISNARPAGNEVRLHRLGRGGSLLDGHRWRWLRHPGGASRLMTWIAAEGIGWEQLTNITGWWFSWNMTGWFFQKCWEWNVIIPIDKLIFFRGIETTKQITSTII